MCKIYKIYNQSLVKKKRVHSAPASHITISSFSSIAAAAAPSAPIKRSESTNEIVVLKYL